MIEKLCSAMVNAATRRRVYPTVFCLRDDGLVGISIPFLDDEKEEEVFAALKERVSRLSPLAVLVFFEARVEVEGKPRDFLVALLFTRHGGGMRWWSIRKGKKGRRVLKETPAPRVAMERHLDFSAVFEVPRYIG